MKKLINPLILLISLSLFSQQDFHENSSATLIISPGSWDDGFSLGAQFEHKNTFIYYGAEVYWFPNLNNLPYHHIIGRVGLNYFLNEKPETTWLRLFAGGSGGAVHRKNEGYHGTLGLEIGFDIIIQPLDAYLRISATSMMKGDSTIWSNENHHTVNSVIIGIGKKF